MGSGRRDLYVTIGLTLVTSAIAGGMLALGKTTWSEAFSFVTGAVSVWLTVRVSPWNFPIGLVNEATFLVVCVYHRLFADGGLQVVWFALTGIGWYLWLYGGPGHTELPVTFAPRRRMLNVGVATLIMWAGLYPILRHVHDSAPLLDSFCTAVSLSAQWLLDRKHIENWIVWFVIDLVYVPLYVGQGLMLSAILYAAFVVMCVIGWRDWRRSMRATEPLAVVPLGAEAA